MRDGGEKEVRGLLIIIGAAVECCLIGLGLFRIKSHCTYDPVAARTEDFSIFQVEILDDRLKEFY